MTFLKYSFITLITLVLIGSAGYLLAAGGIESKPGYAELTLPSRSSTDTTVALSLGPRGLKPLRWVIKRVINASDKELDLSGRLLLSALDDLDGVQLRIYEVKNNRPIFEQAIDASVASLKQESWQTLISVREDNERVVVMQSVSEEVITGVSVLVSTPDEAVFMNLVGQIRPESISAIAESLE